MKKLLFVLLISVSILSAATRSYGATFGIKGGLNLASIDTDSQLSQAEYTGLTGFAAGGTFDFALSPGTALEVDLLYVRKGEHSELEAQDGGTGQMVLMRQDSKLDYLVLAPMIRLSMQRSGAYPYALLGAEIGRLLSATVYNLDANNNTESEGDLDYMYSDMDYGLTFGGGLEFPTGGSAFFFEARYTLGLTGIEESQYSSVMTQKNRGVYILGGMRF